MRYRLPFAAAILAISLLAPAASAIRHASDTAVCPPRTSDSNYCAGPPAIDGHPVTGQANGTATAHVSTSAPGDLLVAFVRSDSPYTIGNASTVFGGGLKWSRVAGVNGALGDAEVWFARATSRLKRAAIAARAVNFPDRFDEVLTVIPFTNATGIGASGTFFSKSGAMRDRVHGLRVGTPRSSKTASAVTTVQPRRCAVAAIRRSKGSARVIGRLSTAHASA
jgi:hypothetical protein